MIAFGCSITDVEAYQRYAEPGLRLAAEPDSEILAFSAAGLNGTGSIFRNYNLLLEAAAKLNDLEALVLIHQDAEIADPDFCAKVRESLRDPDVAIVGCAGAIGVRNIAWWDGSVTCATFTHQYEEYGGGEIVGSTWDLTDAPPQARFGEVDVIDGFMMAVSPWLIREIRFDEALGQFHGYDFDICQQVRAAGKKVVTQHLRVIHHHSLELITDVEGWMAAHMRVAEKWDGRIPSMARPGDWKERARLAEAQADAAMMQANAAELNKDAACLAMKREVEEMRGSTSWRMTSPVRWLGRRVKRAR